MGEDLDLGACRVYRDRELIGELDGLGIKEINVNKEVLENFKAKMINAWETIKKIIAKICEAVSKFFIANPWIIKYVIKNKKYNKRVSNRNSLYIKQKKLGRKL